MEKTAGGIGQALAGGVGGALSGVLTGLGLGAANAFTRRALWDEDTPMITAYSRDMASSAIPMALASGLIGAAQGYMMPNISTLMKQFGPGAM